MFLGTLIVHVLQMTMIEIINMVPMPHSGVATTWAMDVRTCAGRLISAGHWVAFPFSCVALQSSTAGITTDLRPGPL